MFIPLKSSENMAINILSNYTFIPELHLGKVDCTIQSFACSSFDVHTTPAFVLFVLFLFY